MRRSLSGRLGSAFAIALAVAAVAGAARVDVAIPGTPVPQSLQTLAVVLVGGLLGTRRGAAGLAAYLAAGALGVPVFAGGAAGASHLAGPTAGYLIGFVVAATGVGWAADHGHLRSPASALLVTVAAHAVILGTGWARLALDVGSSAAWTGGVAPFIGGGIVKSAVAAGVLAGAARWTARRVARDAG